MTTTRTTTRTAADRAARGERRGRPRPQTPPAAAFLARVAEPVRERLGASVPLAEFLRSAGPLSLAERMLLVDQALVLLEQNYVHLPLKTAMHAVNPLQRLRLLRIRLERQTRATADPEWQFHAEMSQIFHSLRDLHTNYLLPQPYAGAVAYLPFLIEEYTGDEGEPRYLVSHVVQGFGEEGFGPGVEVTHWCGIPIDRAVELNAARFAGSNAAARHSRGLQSLTVRPLVIHVPPDEDWVSLGYRGTDGAARELRHEWLVTENLPPFVADADAVGPAGATQGVDLEADAAGRAKALLFAPQVVATMDAQPGTAAPARPSRGAPAAGAGEPAGEVPTSMPQVFRARAVQTAAGVFGHIRIFTFSVDDPAGFVTEFVRLIGLLPQTGLIVDVRDNGGGHISAAEFTLQALTPRRIQPEPVQFITTPLNLRICRRFADPDGPIDLGPWLPSLDQAREIGATFSGAFPITPAEGANELGQQYHGPVVLITNARCYFATDIFAAGFADHRVGPVLGVDETTGAGGANVWTHGLLKNLLDGPPADPESPYRALPKGANMRVAIRRTLRVGDASGTPVEDLGVTPDVIHRMTRRDLLEGNLDLLDRAGALLAALPVRSLTVAADLDAGRLSLDVAASGLERAVVVLDGQPHTSADLSTGVATVVVDGVPGTRVVRVEGWAAGELVAARTVPLPGRPGVVAGSRARSGAALGPFAAPDDATVVYVHGAGNKPPAGQLKLGWDRDLFGRDMGGRTVMAYYADLLHDRPGAIAEDSCSRGALAGLIADADAGQGSAARAAATQDLLRGLTPRGRHLALRLAMAMSTQVNLRAPGPEEMVTGVLPLPAGLRRLLLRRLLKRLIPDADAYFFTEAREPIRQRLREALDAVPGPLVVVAHSLGTVVAYDVLSEPRLTARPVRLLVTLGCPLGYTEVQDVVTKPLRVPAEVQRWANFADPLDVIALDTGLADDFAGLGRIVDTRVDNSSANNHAPCGYLSTSAVRAVVTAALPVRAAVG